MKRQESPFRDHNGLTWDGAVIRVETSREVHGNLGGKIHGGLLMTMLDSAMGGLVNTLIDDDQVAVTASLTVNFVAAAEAGDVLVARGSVTKQGRSLVFCDGVVTKEGSDAPLATATGTFAVVKRKS